jgi:transposase-like protein
MVKNRKSYKPSYKAQVVLDLLKEEKTLAQISSEYKLSPSVVSKWKNIMIKNVEKVFEDTKSKTSHEKKEYEKQIDELYQEIGRLTTQLNWLKKKCGISIIPG